jgi:hypothetical protein
MQKPGWKTLVLTVAVDYVAAMYLIVSKLDGTDIALVSIPGLIEAVFGWRIGDRKLRPAHKADRAKIQNELDAARSQEVAVGLRWNIAGSAYGENSTSISIATGTQFVVASVGLVAGTVWLGIPQRLLNSDLAITDRARGGCCLHC